MEGSELPRWGRAALVVWWCVAAVLFAVAPAPPSAPLTTGEDDAIFQRQLDQTGARVQR